MVMFTGVYTAVITPFKSDGSFDEKSFEAIIEQQIAGGVDGLVILGTTGESPTVNPIEHEQIMQCALGCAAGRVTLIAGTGSNSTREAVDLSIAAEQMGYDALLQVNPYYNKPNQEGLYQHFKAVADSVTIPIMLYNIAGRCGVNLETSTLLRLAEHPQIVAVKEASGNLEQIREVITQVPDDFTVLSGDDNLTLELMKMGGHGVVSVLSNALPAEMKALVDACANRKWTPAEAMQEKLAALFKLCFIEPSPQPIKTLMAEKGLCEEAFRLPMIKMEASNKTALLTAWEKFQA